MRHAILKPFLAALVLLLCRPSAWAQSCSPGSELEVAVKSALEGAALEMFAYAARGDSEALRARAIPSLASDFGGIASAVSDHQGNLAGAQPSVRVSYLLEAEGTAPLARAQFFCGVFNSPERVAFTIPDLPPGRYGLVILDATGGKSPYTVSLILQQQGGAWKLAGFYPRTRTIAGHDGGWYLTQARKFKAEGATHNAWFYYLTTWDLSAPVNFMSTPELDKLVDEMQSVRPSDLPLNGPVNLVVGGKSYKISDVFAVPSVDSLWLVVKYQVADISNAAQVSSGNLDFIKAWLEKYPEYKEGFTMLEARAVEPSGREFGSPLTLKQKK